MTVFTHSKKSTAWARIWTWNLNYTAVGPPSHTNQQELTHSISIDNNTWGFIEHFHLWWVKALYILIAQKQGMYIYVLTRITMNLWHNNTLISRPVRPKHNESQTSTHAYIHPPRESCTCIHTLLENHTHTHTLNKKKQKIAQIIHFIDSKTKKQHNDKKKQVKRE